ncbi:MAG TPA: CsbD family protein [Clostridia bacterium]|nr:CsbD family protein [Clostridia bacterium]
MDKDRIKGKMEDVKGRVERQVGEWTGDEEAQAEGMKDQAKGKIENAWGKTKDAVRDATEKGDRNVDRDADNDIDRDKNAA